MGVLGSGVKGELHIMAVDLIIGPEEWFAEELRHLNLLLAKWAAFTAVFGA